MTLTVEQIKANIVEREKTTRNTALVFSVCLVLLSAGLGYLAFLTQGWGRAILLILAVVGLGLATALLFAYFRSKATPMAQLEQFLLIKDTLVKKSMRSVGDPDGGSDSESYYLHFKISKKLNITDCVSLTANPRHTGKDKWSMLYETMTPGELCYIIYQSNRPKLIFRAAEWELAEDQFREEKGIYQPL